MRQSDPAREELADLDSVDLRDPMVFRNGDPHAIWYAMRKRSPVHWQQVDDTGFWSVTRYRDVEAVLRDYRTFTSEGGTLLSLLGRPDPASRQQLSATDPPRHTDMRKPLQRLLTGRTAAQYRDRVRAAARALIEPGLDGDAFDFAVAVHKLPVVMFGTLMDLPEQDWQRLTELAETAIAPNDPNHLLRGSKEFTEQRAHRELFAYFQNAATQRRKKLGEDLLSTLLTMTVESAPLDRGSVMANCYLLLIGSTVTVPEVPKAALAELMRSGGYPDWAEHPDLLDSGIEEALRWASPANHVLRYATQPTQLAGIPIAKGDAVVVWYGSANRDDEIFLDPYVFDVRRNPNRHLTFGAGPHYCVGFAIARMTLRTLFEELFRAFEDFEPAGRVEHVASNFVSGISRLPVVGKPRASRRPAVSIGERAT